MRASSIVLSSLLATALAVPFVGCGGDDPAVVPSSGKKGGSGTSGSAGTAAAGAAGTSAAGAAGLSGAAGAGVAGASGAAGTGTTGGAAGTTAGGAAGATAGAGGAAGGKGGTGGAAGSGGSAPVVKKGKGSVRLFAGKETGSTFRNGGTARFVHAPQAGATVPCTTTNDTASGCDIEVCTGVAASPAEVIDGAGTIDVQVALPTGPESKMHLVFDDKARTYSVQETLPTDSAVYQPGQVITLLASGFEAPGFNADVTAPGVLTLTSPAPSGSFSVDSKADLPLTFTGSGSGSLEVVVESTKKDNPAARTTISCSFPAGAAGAKIPSAVLAKLPVADAASYNTTFRVASVATAPVPFLQSYDITVRATTHVLDGSGTPWTSQAATLK